MNLKSKGWVIVLTVACFLCAGYLFKVFTHQEHPVNFSQKVDYFKTHGVPDFQLLALSSEPNQKQFQLSDGNAKVILINFWATWCEPCVTEYPSLVALAHLYQNDPRLKIVAIAVHSNEKDVENFVSKGGRSSNFTVLLDPEGTVASQFGTEKIPETYIINEKHLLLTKVIDQQNWTSTEFLKLLKGWL